MQLAGSLGVWMQRLAQDWLVLQLTGSPAAVGAAVALQFLPMLVVGPVAGLVVDLFPKRRIMMVCQSVIVLLGRWPCRVGCERHPDRVGRLRQLHRLGHHRGGGPAHTAGLRQ